MESPIKTPAFGSATRENGHTASTEPAEAPMPSQSDKSADGKPAIASTIKPDEADEPLLQENPQRFVLFPIKYHEV
jgi:ribonucleoside-diphosphate reductase subunit M2